MKILLSILIILTSLSSFAQTNAEILWEQLQSYCGQSFEGTISQAPENDSFRNQRLIMYVMSCEDNEIKIPFYVGEDKSRTWVLTMQDGKIQLKHDHRHQDGSEDEITQYGGISSNQGLSHIQFFPADEFTCQMIPYACMNVWYITLKDEVFTYNLRRMGTDRVFSVSFDLSKTVETPEKPWGHE